MTVTLREPIRRATFEETRKDHLLTLSVQPLQRPSGTLSVSTARITTAAECEVSGNSMNSQTKLLTAGTQATKT
jgi:hypothetical protein